AEHLLPLGEIANEAVELVDAVHERGAWDDFAVDERIVHYVVLRNRYVIRRNASGYQPPRGAAAVRRRLAAHGRRQAPGDRCARSTRRRGGTRGRRRIPVRSRRTGTAAGTAPRRDCRMRRRRTAD